MSCGDFDGNQLNREAEFNNISLPSYLKRWINLKKAFPAADKIPKVIKEDSFKKESFKW